jgi:hypothetical protein
VKRIIALLLAGVGLSLTITGCETNQIDWKNHFYGVSSRSCLTDGALTLKNGVGVVNGVQVKVRQLVYGDFTHDGVQDVAVVLGCATAYGTVGSEIQVFTRDAKPLMRLTPPGPRTKGALPPAFDLTHIMNIRSSAAGGDNLVTAVVFYTKGATEPASGQAYRWIWNGSGFSPKVNDLS